MITVQEIHKNYCIGCGVCASVVNTQLKLNNRGMYKPNFEDISIEDAEKVLKICPFSSKIQNEDQIAKHLFSSKNQINNEFIGFYLQNYVGHVIDNGTRSLSSSGGIISYILTKLLESNKISHAIHVRNSDSNGIIFKYKLSKTTEEIFEGASSKYYPVELSEVLDYISKNKGSFALVALPCYVKSIRLLQQQKLIFKERIKFIISPVCGHLKTANYAKFLALQKGIDPDKITHVNFRKKISDQLASNYATEFTILDNETETKKTFANTSFKMGTDWGHGMFKNPVCDFCDDIFGELADVSVGDAWLKEYLNDNKGNSVIINRNDFISELLTEGELNDKLYLDKVNPTDVIRSQGGGIRNKRDDLKYRLWIKEKKGEKYPIKRMKPSSSHLSLKRKALIKYRIKISNISHSLYVKAKEKNDINIYYKKINRLLQYYSLINKGIIKYIIYKIKRVL